MQKIIKIPLLLNKNQKVIFNEWLNTSNYIYNKTVEYIKNGQPVNFFNLRDLLVTNITKKTSGEYKSFDEIINKLKKEKIDIYQEIKQDPNNKDKIKKLDDKQQEINIQNQKRRDLVKNIKGCKNKNINNWELNTPKEIRACAVNDVCKAHKTGFSQLESGLIKFFNMKYRKKINQKQSLTIPSNYLKLNNNHIKIAPKFFKDDCNIKIGKSTIKKIKDKNILINHDCKLIKHKNKFWLYILTNEKQQQNKPVKLINYCGIDPGVRTFLTVFGNNGCLEYKHNKLLFNKLNYQIDSIKRSKKIRIKKKAFTKRENKKINVINEVHWLSINSLLKNNDIIFYGDIKSHDIVKHKKNHNLNRAVNDLKFYTFKERLLYKANQQNKIVKLVNEAFTTQTCSFCGANNKPKQLETYNCLSCNKIFGRDINASKNILMKGIIENKLHI